MVNRGRQSAFPCAPWPCSKEPPLSPQSGRLKVAQRFIAGIGGKPEMKSVKRTAERAEGQALLFSRPLHGLKILRQFYPPAVNCWATISRPLCGLQPNFCKRTCRCYKHFASLRRGANLDWDLDRLLYYLLFTIYHSPAYDEANNLQ